MKTTKQTKATKQAKRGRPSKQAQEAVEREMSRLFGPKSKKEQPKAPEPTVQVVIKPTSMALDLLHWALLVFAVLCLVYMAIPMAIGFAVAFGMLWVYTKVFNFFASYLIVKVKGQTNA